MSKYKGGPIFLVKGYFAPIASNKMLPGERFKRNRKAGIGDASGIRIVEQQPLF
jgi:hypothetical protein